MTLPVPLYIPNLLGYLRIALALIGLGLSSNAPVTALWIWLIAAFLDLIDGMLARKLNQTSTLGIFLDIAADNILRTSVWIAAIISSINTTDNTTTNDDDDSLNSSMALVVACCIISLEWFTMVCTQLHAAQFEKHWKSERQHDPWLVQQVFKNGFKAPFGILTRYGLFSVQMWLYGRNHPSLRDPIPLFDVWMYLAILGRMLGLCVEFWLCWSFLRLIVERDTEAKRNPPSTAKKGE